MASIDSTGWTIADIAEPDQLDETQLAAVAFLARYSGWTLDAYRLRVEGGGATAGDGQPALL